MKAKGRGICKGINVTFFKFLGEAHCLLAMGLPQTPSNKDKGHRPSLQQASKGRAFIQKPTQESSPFTPHLFVIYYTQKEAIPWAVYTPSRACCLC